MAEVQAFLASLLEPTPLAILISLILVITLPLFLHFVIYRSSNSTTLPSFLLIGPSGAGKTSLLTLLERGRPAPTRTSQTTLTVECSLPISTPTASSRYRSRHDPTTQIHKPFLLADTPGHGKLKHHALSGILHPQNLRGVIFVVDAADLTSTAASTDGGGGGGAGGEDGLRIAAEYLHDVLLILQKRAEKNRKEMAGGMRVLVAANKMDLFTALPVGLVRTVLEKEIGEVRASRGKGLLDSGVGMDETEERDWLGEGEGKFDFGQCEESGVVVEVRGGSVTEEGSDVGAWWEWIGTCL